MKGFKEKLLRIAGTVIAVGSALFAVLHHEYGLLAAIGFLFVILLAIFDWLDIFGGGGGTTL